MNLSWLKFGAKQIVGAVVLLAIVLGFWKVWSAISDRDAEIAELATRLASSQETVEIQAGLYATQTVAVKNLNSAIEALASDLGESGETVKALLDQIDKAEQRILVAEGLAVKWKKAYEAAVEASQTEEPGPTPSDPVRKRVDFKKDFGPIGVSGYTITDPPEGYVKIEQLRPLYLTLAVTKNKDGTWSTYVASSEENMEVDITLSGIDLSVVTQKWYQRLWLDVGANLNGASVGVSYRGDRWGFGPECTVGTDIKGCGLMVGYRLFK